MLGIFPLFAIPSVCPHSWRLLTSEDDYGNGLSRHWGGYTGVDQEECRWCGSMQKIPRAVIEARKQAKSDAVPEAIRALKPWRRGSYGCGMKPNKSMNQCGTFCKKCGDWIEDGAYYAEHGTLRCPRPGSWNYENQKNKRSSDDDIQPNHEEWLDEMREYAKRNMGHSFVSGGSGSYIGLGVRQFHSHEEARTILEPYGITLNDSGDGMHGDYIVRRRAGIMADYGSGPVKDKLTKKEIAHANKINAAYIKRHGKLKSSAA